MTYGLAWTFGRLNGLTPLLDALNMIVGERVDIRAREHREWGGTWSWGVLRRVEVQGDHAVLMIDMGGAVSPIHLPPEGTASWACPRRRHLRVDDDDGRSLELSLADSGERILDGLERQLGDALAEADPRCRHGALAGLREEASFLKDYQTGPQRARMAALAEFLDVYR